MNSVVLFIKLTRPLFIFGSVLIYSLGAGAASYLEYRIDWTTFLIGLLWALSLQLSTHFLNEYFNAREDQTNQNRTPFSGGSGALGEGKLPRITALYAAFVALALLSSLSFLIISASLANATTILIMLLSFLGAILYSVPPIRLERTGYGELIASIIVAFLLPLFAFMLQADVFHRLIAITALPLTFLHLGMMIVFELPDFSNDQKHGKLTLLVRTGLDQGTWLHNILIIFTYVILIILAFLGLPVQIFVSAMLSLPFALLQIWQIAKIKSGRHLNWNALTLNALVTFGSMVYFVTFSFWVS